MDDNENKAARILAIYDRLRKGYVLQKRELVQEWGVNAKTIQRDLAEVRAYLANRYQGEEVVFDYSLKGYKLEHASQKHVSAVEMFALVKILLESRAFCKEEMEGLLDLLCSMISKEELKTMKELFINERFHFQPLAHGKPILKIIWDLGQCIMKREVIELDFTKANGTPGRRIVHPLSIVFSEFYFYLIAQIEGSTYEHPAFFRVDRLSSFKLLGRRYEARRFEDGEMKKRIQFMYGGELYRLQFIYKGQAIEAVADRFPTAKIAARSEGGYDVEAEVFGTGCLMWLLGQGEDVELIGPAKLREEMKRKIRHIYDTYHKE